MEEEFDLMDMIKYFWSKKVLIICIGIICLILGLLYTKFLIIPKYTSVSKFILTNNNFDTEAEVDAYTRLPDRYFAVTKSRNVLNKVIENLKLDIDDISTFEEESVTITHFPANFIICVEVTTEDAKKTADIANEIVKVAIEEIDRIYKDNNIQILDYATENWKPVNVNLFKNIAMFMFAGEAIVCIYILIRYVFIEKNNSNEEKSK